MQPYHSKCTTVSRQEVTYTVNSSRIINLFSVWKEKNGTNTHLTAM
jgi:hypothetical protein